MERLTPVLKLNERDLAGPMEVIKQEVKIWFRELSKDDEEIQAMSFAGCINLAKTLSLPHVVTPLRLYATLPSSTASAERCFSRLRQLKSWLHANMGRSRLCGLALLKIHQQVEIDVNKVIDRFRDTGNRRILL